MIIVNQKLWDSATPHFRKTAEAVMIGAPTARIALYFAEDHPEYPGKYKISWLGPRKDATTVATNLDTWI